MSKVVVDVSLSADGKVAEAPDVPGVVLDWLRGGARSNRKLTEATGTEFRSQGADADVLTETLLDFGAVIVGRRLYDAELGWHGSHPNVGVPIFVLSHDQPDAVPVGRSRFTFVAGVPEIVGRARIAAKGRKVLVQGGSNTIRQVLTLGLADELHLHVAPVLLGAGVPFLSQLSGRLDLRLMRVVQGPAALHLRYQIIRVV